MKIAANSTAELILKNIEIVKNADFEKVIMALKETGHNTDKLIEFMAKIGESADLNDKTGNDNPDELLKSYNLDSTDLEIVEFVIQKLK